MKILIKGFNPFIEAAISAVSIIPQARFKIVREINEYRNKPETLTLVRDRLYVKGKYRPHQGKKEIARRLLSA